MINEKTGLAVAFHTLPLIRFPTEKEALRQAINYWKTLQFLAPIEPTRFDFASNTGGWRWNSHEENQRERKEVPSHRTMLEAFAQVYGSTTKYSRWTTAQIQYDPKTTEVIDPHTEEVLPREGAIDYWVDLNNR